MPDRLVHLERGLVAVDDERRHLGRARVRGQERGSLFGHPRRLALDVERLHELPAGLLRHADARRGVTARLVDAVAGRGAVDAGTRLDRLLLDVAPFGRDEDLVLAAGTRERLPHDHGRALHRFVRA